MSRADLNQFNEIEISALVLTNQILSGITIASCTIILLIYWFFKEIRDFILETINYMCISILLEKLTVYIPYNNNRNENMVWCGTQAFLGITFQYSAWIWSCIIGYCCFISVIKKDHFQNNSFTYRLCFIVISLVISLSLASIIIFTDSWGPTGGWCWVDVYNCSTKIHKLILFYYCVNWFFIVLSTFFIFKVVSILKSHYVQGTKNRYLLSMYRWLKWFPIIQIICILPATVSRIYNVLDMPSNFVLVLIQTIFSSLIGLGYLIIYIKIPQVNTSLKIFFSKICNKEGERTNDNINNTSFDFSSDVLSNHQTSNKENLINNNMKHNFSEDF